VVVVEIGHMARERLQVRAESFAVISSHFADLLSKKNALPTRTTNNNTKQEQHLRTLFE
jgi:hypothetical protein